MNTEESAPESARSKPTPARRPLGCLDREQVNRTLLRVIGRQNYDTALDVAAFQSFVQ